MLRLSLTKQRSNIKHQTLSFLDLGGLKLTPTSEEEIRRKIGVKYIESMAVADKSVVKFHGKDKVARYILALMNVVS